MPKVGLSRPYLARYNHNGVGGVTYTDGVTMGRAVEYSLEVETGDDNDFYANNTVAETASGTFVSGTLTTTVAENTPEINSLIIGIKEEEFEVNGQKIKAYVYDDDAAAPDLGYGVIIKNIIRGATSWRAVVLTKVKFNVPADAATTQGDAIDWQTDEIEAKVMRDDSEKHRWKIEKTVATEAEADAFIRAVLNIKETSLDTLTVVSTAGTETGKTAIAITPDMGSGHSYRYKLDADLPMLDQDLSTWTAWDVNAEIAAATGQVIVVAEVDTSGLAKEAGKTTVMAKEDAAG